MGKLYFQFDIPNLELIKPDLIARYQDRFSGEEMSSFLVDWSEENFLGLYDFLQPKLRKKYLFVKRSRFFITPPGYSMYPHIDGTEYDENSYALNIPILSQDDHYQLWYEQPKNLIKISSSTYADCLISSAGENLKIIDRLKLDMPHFVKIGILHSVLNLSNKHRVVLSIRIRSPFDPNIDYEKIFENL
jgi:hypothetical protein